MWITTHDWKHRYSLAKICWRVEHAYREPKHALGMDHSEGRSFTGKHRHVTLVVLAQAFGTLLDTATRPENPHAGLTIHTIVRAQHQLRIRMPAGATPANAPYPDTSQRLVRGVFDPVPE